ncbi:MAG: DUF2911 domain-containing protein [Acidobacteriota bacterium]|jgi:hypothetical protein|nr:MAG: hypothetical protein DIU54_02450 [Acidobacteriota bacterium]
MRRLAATAIALAAVCTIGVAAQKTTDVPTKGPNPHVRSEWSIDGANISITYGRPSLKGRSLESFDWWGREWRTGADERTRLSTDRTLRFGDLEVPAGTYGLYTKTGDSWELIISKAADGWGVPYPQGQDLGRAPMRVGKAPEAAELLTFSIDDTPTGGTLHIDWGTTRASIDFTVAQ